ncbi:Uncharacterised protein [Mycobacteroides abscessus subsp. massiliense]|nr:Uncharacterised protein [Mycobacteroides abscessus subsp. massiliense]
MCNRHLRVLFRHFQPDFAFAYGFGDKLHLLAVFTFQNLFQSIRNRKVADDDVGFAFAQIVLGDEGFGVILSVWLGIVFGVWEKAFIADMPSAADADPVYADQAV